MVAELNSTGEEVESEALGSVPAEPEAKADEPEELPLKRRKTGPKAKPKRAPATPKVPPAAPAAPAAPASTSSEMLAPALTPAPAVVPKAKAAPKLSRKKQLDLLTAGDDVEEAEETQVVETQEAADGTQGLSVGIFKNMKMILSHRNIIEY